jgi:aspartyl-tRNA(Asn)/glutamyl-tRNA(Gln) amidotransferase subunit C
MSVTRDEVRRIARLAELHVEDDALPVLTEQLSHILDYVAQLAQVPASEHAAPFLAGPDALLLRPDEVRPWPLAAKPAQFAPAFREGFFTVPRLGQFDAGTDAPAEPEE